MCMKSEFPGGERVVNSGSPRGGRPGNCRYPHGSQLCRQAKPRVTSAVLPLFGIVGAVHSMLSHPATAWRTFLAATLFCGVAFGDEAITRQSTDFFDRYCGECHYEDQNGGL